MAIVDMAATAADATWHVFKIILMVAAVVAIVGGLWWMGYVTFYKPIMNPTPTTTQNAQSIDNNSYYPAKKVFGLGFTLWGTDFGITRYDFPQKPTIKETNVDPKVNTTVHK